MEVGCVGGGTEDYRTRGELCCLGAYQSLFADLTSPPSQNQEALRALATRAMRAEARIKLLEEARVHDSSSASGSGSPATRPSSIAGSSEMPAEMLPPPISFDENDSSARDSPPGVKVR